MSANVAVIGLGKLGAPMAVCLASLGHHVHVTDASTDVRIRWALGAAPVDEPQLQEMMTKYESRLHLHQSTLSAAVAADIIFVIVPTPSMSNGRFSVLHVIAAMREIGLALHKHTARYPVVVLTSTVMPGDTNGHDIRTTLERVSGKVAGKDFGLAYSPEFIALGSVIRDWLEPDMILLGADDALAREIVSDVYRPLNRPIVHVSIASAELAKIAVNTYITAKINFVNTLTRMCDATPGADVDEVSLVMGFDARIGKQYLRGGTAYGGPCFPRDNRALSLYGAHIGIPFPVAEEVDRMNRNHARYLAGQVLRHHESGAIGIVGLAYKPGTGVTEESASIALAEQLRTRGHEVLAWDPLAPILSNTCYQRMAVFTDLIENCSTIVLMHDTLDANTTPAMWGSTTVIDCWRAFPQLAKSAKKYVPLGRYIDKETS